MDEGLDRSCRSLGMIETTDACESIGCDGRYGLAGVAVMSIAAYVFQDGRFTCAQVLWELLVWRPITTLVFGPRDSVTHAACQKAQS